MARPVGSNSLLEVALVSTYQGSTILNIIHYRLLTAAPAVLDGDLVVDAAIAVLQTPAESLAKVFRDAANAAMELLHFRYQWIFPDRYSPVQVDDNCGAGQNANDGLPSNVAGVITKRSIFAGPHGHGSFHMSGLSAGDTNGALLAGPYKVLLSVIAARLDDSISLSALLSGASLVPVIHDRASPATSAQWGEASVQDTARVMRRRTLGVGI